MKKFGIAVKAVIFKQDKVFIIKKSSSEDVAPNTWDLPGGRVSFGEEPKKALEREVKEETGFEVKVLQHYRVWNYVKKDFHLFGITFICEYIKGKEKLSDEHVEHKWISRKDIKNLKVPKWFKEELEEAFKIKGAS